jgi:excisionase family DNA binding protein
VSEITHISRSEMRTHWLPVSAAAKRLRVSRQRVYQLLRDGLITGTRVDRTWFVSTRSVEARVALLRSEGGD